MSNLKKWNDFLAPVKATEPRPKDSFDNTFISIPCMALDLARLLNKEVAVDEKELKVYKDREVKTEDEIGYGGENDYEESDEENEVVKEKESSVSSMPSDQTQELEEIDNDDEDREVKTEESDEETSGSSPLRPEVAGKSLAGGDSKPEILNSVDREAKTEPVDGNGDDGEKDDVKSIESKSPIRTDLTQELKEIVEDKDTQLYKESKLLRRDHNEIPFSIAHRHVTPEAVCKSLAGGDSKPTLVEILSSEIQADYTGSITSVSPKDKPGVRQTKIVDDRSTSVSKWTLKKFVYYVDFDKYVRELDLPFDHELKLCGQTTGAEDVDLKDFFADILGMFGSNSLKDCMLSENASRVFLDRILMKLCKQYKLRVQMEYHCNLQYLPTSKFDYLITNKDGVPLGCVEAKSPAGFEKKSFCQAVLELILVQDLAAKKGVDVEKTPVFCILSDGNRYILMQLKGKELFLEHDIPMAPTSTTPKVIKLRELDGQDDFKKLISSITTLITDSMRST